MKDLLRRLDGYQRERPWLAFPLAVVKRFGQDRAGNLAALIAYYAFFSVFPLLLAANAVLGFVLQGSPHLRHSVETSYLSRVPIIGNSLQGHQLTGSGLALGIGLVLALWSGIGVARIAQTAFDDVYGVPRDERPNVVVKTRRALGLLVTVGLGLVVSTFVSGVVTGSSNVLPSVDLGVLGRVAGFVVTVVLDVVVFVLAFDWLTVRDLRWRESLPGAALAGVAWYVLQSAATFLITQKLNGAKSTYGDFAMVIALLSWFYLAAQFVLLGAEVNVVRTRRLWPVPLLSPRQEPSAPRPDRDTRTAPG